MKVNNETGEVLETGYKYNSAFNSAEEIVGQDLSREEEEVFEEVAPFAIDPATGEFLNKTSRPLIVSKGKINIQEKISSFGREVDLYSILEKFAYSGDMAYLNARECAYGDISEMPTDLNGFAKLVDLQYDKLKELNPELAAMVVNENIKPGDIEARAIEIMKERNDAAAASKEESK